MPVITPRLFNQIEVVLWAVFALYFVYRAVTDAACRSHASIAAVAFLFFSGSDAVEIHTGAWWRPWWLFAWKATCVITLLGIWWTWPAQNTADTEPSADEP